MKQIRWGVIGCGGIADLRTIPGMLLAENAVCVAVMDTNPESAERVKKKYNIARAYTQINELLAQPDIDAVYIATPVFCHKEQVILAADAGKHILLEKPMGVTVEEAREMADYCLAKGVKLAVGFMMRFHDAHQNIKAELARGTIGEVVSAYAKFNCWYPVSEAIWRQTKAFSGGGAMPDHRAAGQLVIDASYLLTVPNECPDVPAMRFMPVIMCHEDPFTNPRFRPDIVVDIDAEADVKLQIANINVSQVYEWLPYTYGEEVPEGEEERFEWLKGLAITGETTDEEVMAAARGYAVNNAKPAARHRQKLIETYGLERGSKIRYAEAYEVCEYGAPMTEKMKKEILF